MIQGQILNPIQESYYRTILQYSKARLAALCERERPDLQPAWFATATKSDLAYAIVSKPRTTTSIISGDVMQAQTRIVA